MWGQNGTTFKRFAIDQAPVVPSLSTSQVRVPFQALTQAGFLRRLLLQIPRTQYGLTVTTANYLSVGNTEQDLPALRALATVKLTLQRIAPLYDLNRGIDLGFLEYMSAGRTHITTQSAFGSASFLTATNKALFGKTSSAWDYIFGVVSITAGAGTSQNVQFGLVADLPITEYIKFPAGVAMDTQGNSVAIPETYGEVGLVTLQNSQQNVVPAILLNPAWNIAASVNQIWNSNTTNPSTPINPTVNLWSEFYDVPESPQDWPPGYAFDYVIQYQSFDDAIANGKVTHKFDNAGMLMRACYVFLDSTDKVVDCSTLASDGQIAFKWGASVQHRQSNFQANISDAAELYGNPPLFGSLYHDFFTEDQSVWNMVDTSKITSPRCEITGAPGSAATLHTIEQRLIPVMVRQG